MRYRLFVAVLFEPFNMEYVIRTMNGHGVLMRCATMLHRMGWQNAMSVSLKKSYKRTYARHG